MPFVSSTLSVDEKHNLRNESSTFKILIAIRTLCVQVLTNMSNIIQEYILIVYLNKLFIFIEQLL